jgi:FlaA1/EpsC-like NDP-sugar epimerase
MGEPVRIVDLAQDLVRLSGLEVGRDIDIVFTGLRPGDKLFEELFANGELYGRTRHHKIFISLNGKHELAGPAGLERAVAELVELAQERDDACVRARLQEMVPEYDPQRN